MAINVAVEASARVVFVTLNLTHFAKSKARWEEIATVTMNALLACIASLVRIDAKQNYKVGMVVTTIVVVHPGTVRSPHTGVLQLFISVSPEIPPLSHIL